MTRDIVPRGTKRQEADTIILKFAGGLSTRASIIDINDNECVDGQNFDLDLQNFAFRPRAPYDKIGTATNSAEIRGFASLQKTDGSVSMLVQAGNTVYQWDGTNFTSKGTVSATAQLRGRLSHNWELDDVVLITDLNLQEQVYQWNGSTLSTVTFTKNDGSTGWTGEFRAKYCTIDSERVMFSNVNDNSTAYPHLIVGSKRGSYTIISNDQRPSSSLSEEDPFFLLQPDLRPINGFVGAFNTVATSSRGGAMFQLTGASAKDFSFTPLYPRSGADGAESVVYVGNDIFYGRQGRIESLAATQKFGDVETNDLSEDIENSIEDYKDWTAVYNERNQRAYFMPSGKNQLWVLHKPLLGMRISPWSKWVTANSLNMNFTAMMNCLDPTDGLEYVFAGDASGNLYKIEGSVNGGDGDGNTAVQTERLSKLFSFQQNAEVFDFEGWILFEKKAVETTVTIKFEYNGDSIFNEEITETLTGIPSAAYFSGGSYFSAGKYFGKAVSGRLTRRGWGIAGRSTEFQIRTTVDNKNDFEIAEIGCRFTAAT